MFETLFSFLFIAIALFIFMIPPKQKRIIDLSQVVIDDFKVPHRNDLHYDQYGDIKCSYKCICNHLDQIYSSYKYYYVIPKNTMSRAKFVAIPKKWGKLCKLNSI